MKTEVLIVGASPTGLMLSALLGRAGVRCRLIDSGMDPVRGSRLYGPRVEWQTTLLDFSQEEEGVVAAIQRPGGFEEIGYADYLVGCDGSRSRVKEELGLAFEGESQVRVNRTFLLGAAGRSQTGLEDAANLAWKLALVLQKGVSDSLLDTDSLERLPNIQVGSGYALLDLLKGYHFTVLIFSRLNRGISASPGPVDFLGVQVLRLPSCPYKSEGYVLVRPDGYIAFQSEQVDREAEEGLRKMLSYFGLSQEIERVRSAA